jgi:hypothetical protein
VIIKGRYFNFKLEAVKSLLDYTLWALGYLQVAKGIPNSLRLGSPSMMCITEGVMEYIKEDVPFHGRGYICVPTVLQQKCHHSIFEGTNSGRVTWIWSKS